MDAQARRQIGAYFAGFPHLLIGIMAVGVVILFAARGPLGYSIGLGAILASGAVVVLWSKSQPSDEQMDLWLREDLEALKPRALAKANLLKEDTVRDSVVVIGFRYQNIGGASLGFRRGRDQRARFTPVDTTIINFTEHQLVIYQCVLDRTTGKPLNEGVDEYFYNDVVSVSTQSQAMTVELSEVDRRLHSKLSELKESAVNGKLQVNGAEMFILATAGGTFVRVVLNDPIIIRGLGEGALPSEFADEAVQAVRKMLREKKAGSLPIRGAGGS
jgi:hypothetical protein